MFFSFRWKILGGFLGLLAAVLGSSLWLLGHFETRATEGRVRDQLNVAQTVFNSILDRRSRQLAGSVDLLGHDFAFKQAVAQRDPQTIESAADNLRVRIAADALWVTDEDGRLYADTTRRFKTGLSIARLPVVASALNGESAARILTINGVVYQTAAAPVNAPDLIGTLIAGFAIDNALAAELKRQTQADVSFSANGRIFASTLPKALRSALENLGKFPAGRPLLVLEGKGNSGVGSASTELVLLTEPEPGITVYLQRSWDEALEPLRRQQRLILALGLAGFAVALLFGFFLSEGVTAPVIKLVAASKRLVEGDYQARVEISQRDEIGQLGRTFNWMVEGLEQKEKIRALLRKAVSKEIAEELIRSGQINLGGQEKTVTVLFADIRGFTSFSESASAPQVVAQLNDYFGRMARVIDEHHGVIDKFIGDALMALFGAPLASAGDADNALRAALALARALERLNEDRARNGLAAWTNVIGLNTGPAVVGTMGSSERWSYTVVGDSVNLASRLESLTRYYGVRIALSAATKTAARGNFVFRTLDLVRVKGKREAVEIFELLGEEIPPPEWLKFFEEAVSAYRRRQFARAKERFQEVLRLSPEDAPRKLYLERLSPLLQSVPKDWDPVVTMSEK